MTPTPTETELVQSSFQQLAPRAEELAERFYRNLFEAAPHVRGMFKGDMTAQGRKLVAALATVVHSMDRLDAVIPVAEQLARRHVSYGVEAQHYDLVGGVLLGTLKEFAGDAFTGAHERAWALAYTTLAAAMKKAAYESFEAAA